MPSVSNTARIGPPAMMPVPGGAARRNTRPAPWRPATSWCSVRPSRSGTRMSPRLAASVALRIASGTSRALPWPKPTRPFSSPTTTSAAKPKRRPPFTTLATRLMWTSLSVNSLSRSSRSRRSRGSRAMILFQLVLVCRRSSSETEPALARRVRQRLDAAVVEVTAAIEHDLLDALRRCALGEPFADRLCRLDIGAGLEGAAHVLLQRGGGCEGLAIRVVDHLRINVFRRAEDRKPHATAGGAADVAPHFRRPPQGSISDGRHRALPSFLLAFFAEDVFARVLDALALIGFGLAESADFGGDVADFLLVDAGDDDLGRLGYRDRDALRDRINDVVAIAELDLQVLALQGGAIADAADLESALETFGHSRHRIGEQRPAGPPHGARALGIGARIDLDFAALHLGRHIAVQRDRKRALGALHLDELALHAGGDAGGNRNGFFSDTGHGWLSVCVLLERSLGDHARTPRCTARRLLRFISKDRAENFSAHVVVARVVIGHHALGCRQDRNSQSVVHARETLDRGVDPPSRLRHPRNLADHRLAVGIFQLDLEFFAPVRVLDRGVATDEAFGFEHIQHAHAQPGRRRRYLRLVAHLRIVNAGDHIAERIVHSHRPALLTSST